MDFDLATPEVIAAIAEEIDREVNYVPVRPTAPARLPNELPSY